MRYDYKPEYDAFVSSMKGYSKLVKLYATLTFVRTLVLPIIGTAAVGLWIYIRFFGPGDPEGVFTVLAGCGVFLGVLGPAVQMWQMKRLFKMRASLAPDGMYAEADDAQIVLVLPGRAEVKVAWSTFTHTFEEQVAITLYYTKSGFNTIPKDGMPPEFLQILHRNLQHAKRL